MKQASAGHQGLGGFPREGVAFLRQLKRNNNRDWFQSHKEAYERLVRAPMEEMVLSIGEAFRRIAPEMVADPRVSIYRIYRDTRFSKDKTPYKTHVAAVFPVRGLPKNSGPGLYFHVSPEEVLIGGGIYMPEPELLRAVREQIAAHPKKFLAIVEGTQFRKAFGELEGEQLKTNPKGFTPNHEAIRYLRYKQFLFGEEHPAALAMTPRLLPTILKCFEKGMPLIRFMSEPAARVVSSSARQKSINSYRPCM
ncbi:MAG: DUF2461 domain-containing protein [Acidobacteria bacterium]|nr:DUF2461 domain-containing protein [Acidobacteriota bacterium]